MTRQLLGKGWSFPLRFDAASGGVATSAGEENIRESMTIILGTRPGERQMMPDFGCRIHELMFAPGTAANAALISWHVKQALLKWEPRIDVVGVDSRTDGGGKVKVSVRYRVKTSHTEQLLDLDLSPGG